MTVSITHPFVSEIPDEPSALANGEVKPSDWNANHTITMGASALLGRNVGSSGAVLELDAPTVRDFLDLVPGTDVQVWDADLDAIAALGTTGLAVRTGVATWATRSIVQPGAGITVTNGDGVAGNPTLALANDLAALEALTGTGTAKRTGTDAWALFASPFSGSRVFGSGPTLGLDATDVGKMIFVDTYNSGSSQGLIAVTLPTGLGAADEGAVIGIMKYPETPGSINGHAGQVTVTNGDFTHYLNTPYKVGIYQWSGTKWRLMAPDLQSLRGHHVTIHRTVSSTPFSVDFNRDQGSVLRGATNVVGGNVQLDLPAISTTSVPGATYMTSDAWVQKSGVDNYRLVLVPQNGESLNGISYVSFYTGLGQGVMSLTHDKDTLHLESDGNEWSILGGRLATDGIVQNALRNSAFKLWGGATGATARADGAEFAPSWSVLTQTAAVNLSRLDNPWEGARYAARVTQNQASAQRFGFVTWVPGADSAHRRSLTHIFGAKMRSNVGGTIVRYALLSWTGTEDAPTIDVVNDWTNGTYSAGQFFIGSNLTVTQHGFMNLITADQVYDLVPLQGQFSASLNNVMLLVWTESAAAQNTTVDISLGMLAPGGVPRLHRDESAATEQVAAGAGFTNTRLAKTAAYTVVNADRGKTIALGGSASYALTFGAATGYDPSFSVIVVNEDTARGKEVDLTAGGGTRFFVWPGQTVLVYNSNNVWKSDGPKRWILSGNITIHVASGGSDNNDGLAATGNGPLATLQAAYDRFTKFFDTRRFGGDISLGSGAFTTAGDGLHADGQPLGAGGGGQIDIVGAGSGLTTIRSTGGSAVAVYYDTVIGLQGVTLQADVGNGLVVDRGGFVQIIDDVAFAACGAAHVVVSDTATLLTSGTVRLNGNPALAHLAAASGCFIRWSANVVFDANITASYFVLCNIGAHVQYSGATITLGAFTFTGRRYYADTASVLYSATGNADTYFPGTIPGQNLTNAVVDGVAADILAAQLPAFGSGDVSFAADGGAGTIAADAVTNAKLSNMATATLKGRTTAGTGDPEDLTVAQSQALLMTGELQSVATTVSFASAADTAIAVPLPTGYSQIRFSGLMIHGASGDISTATFGLFLSTGGVGQIIAAGTAITVTNATANTNNNAQFVTAITNANTEVYTANGTVAGSVQFRVGATVAQTAKVTIYYRPVI